MAFSKMFFLFSKFQQGVSLLAKSTTFAKNSKQIQLEADTNKLFMFTRLVYTHTTIVFQRCNVILILKILCDISYNRLGRDAEEADAEEIIEIAGKSNFSEQQKQVQENIHCQVQNFCSSMDEILLPDFAKAKDRNESGSRSGPYTSGDTVVHKTKPLTLAEVSLLLKNRIGYTLEVKPSLIPHKDAGQGCFIEGEADVGAVLAFYPGVIYSPAFYKYIPGYPNMDAQDSYMITRHDGIVINAQPWCHGGESQKLWDGSFTTPEIRTDAKTTENGLDKVRKLQNRQFEGLSNVEAVLEMRNPLAFGHFVNHPGEGMEPNVMVCPYDFLLSEKEMRPYIPNVVFKYTEDDKMRRFRSFLSRTGSNSGLDAPVLKTIVLVATRALCNEELFLNYRLSCSERRPEWYTSVGEEEDQRR
ncbi:unnamed protein product [Cochlearia groenlandica]